MARLFITPREIDYISDITKEITKDVIGQKIYYYRVREDATRVHDVYEEAMDKVFDPPLEVDADRKSTRLNSSHSQQSRMPSSA